MGTIGFVSLRAFKRVPIIMRSLLCEGVMILWVPLDLSH